MARAKMDQWNLRFGIVRDAAGYAWQRMPQPELPLALAPAGRYWEREPGLYADSVQTRRKDGENGLAIARAAYRRFRGLARQLETMSQDLNMLGFAVLATGEPTDDDSAKRSQIVAAAEQSVVDYANDFGTLWGDDDPRALDEWRDEAVMFLDAEDIAAAVRPGSDRSTFDACVKVWNNGRTIDYVSPRPHGHRYTITSKGNWREWRDEHGGAIVDQVEWFDWIMQATPHERARFLFRKLINAKLDGGLSLEASLRSPGKAVITPNHLIHLLYARMWLDADRLGDPVRLCEECETVLEGKQRRFCSDKCRQKQYRRRQPADRSAPSR